MAAELHRTLGDEPAVLLGERALWLPAHAALLIADLHLGKADVFRRAGIALPRGGTDSDLQRLQRLIAHTGCTQLWILGDMLHGPLNAGAWLQQWRDVRARHARLAVHLLRGNHDRMASAQALQVSVHAQARLGGLVLRHEPAADPGGAHVLAGHVHPQIALPGLSRRFPAFWLQAGMTILPAFSRFTAGVTPALQRGEQLVACVEGELVALPPR